MMVSAPDPKGRYLFTPLVVKRTTWEDYYSRRDDYDSANGNFMYEQCKEKNQSTTHEGETGVACIVLVSMRNEVAFSMPMFFKHSYLNKIGEDNRWDKRYSLLERVCSCVLI